MRTGEHSANIKLCENARKDLGHLHRFCATHWSPGGPVIWMSHKPHISSCLMTSLSAIVRKNLSKCSNSDVMFRLLDSNSDLQGTCALNSGPQTMYRLALVLNHHLIAYKRTQDLSTLVQFTTADMAFTLRFCCLFGFCSFVQSHRFSYNEPMPIESTTQSLCDLALRFGEDGDEGGGMVSELVEHSFVQGPLQWRKRDMPRHFVFEHRHAARAHGNLNQVIQFYTGYI